MPIQCLQAQVRKCYQIVYFQYRQINYKNATFLSKEMLPNRKLEKFRSLERTWLLILSERYYFSLKKVYKWSTEIYGFLLTFKCCMLFSLKVSTFSRAMQWHSRVSKLRWLKTWKEILQKNAEVSNSTFTCWSWNDERSVNV